MRVLLINVPHPAIGSRIPSDHLPPLGLLAIGGPLIDAGHEVRLIDGDRLGASVGALIAEAVAWRPDAVLFGHSGSSSGHPVIAETARGIASVLPQTRIVYGGVYPTYHWRDILEAEPYVSAIVRGEGEETVCRLMDALSAGRSISAVPGIAFPTAAGPRATAPAVPVRNLDAFRTGWELINHADYSYWGGLRAVVVQFSRGCPHVCTYCGQRMFWNRWRHRNPVQFAKEIARLYREHGVKVFNFADENPLVSKKAWKTFLEALIAEEIDPILVASARADDIVRDTDILHLYKRAGFARFLLGIENTSEATLAAIRKRAATTTDREAIRLLRRHNIISLATWAAGFEEETDRDHWRGLRQLLQYDPDQIQLIYATPHRWTPFATQAAGREVIQPDLRLWDYKHQVLSNRRMPPWRVLAWVKFTELVLQSRPKALYRTFLHQDKGFRHGMQWYTQIGRRVWFHEVWRFFRDCRVRNGPSVAAFLGKAEDDNWDAPARARQSGAALDEDALV
jgi:anaerobic magnesium-protoporphyrin IX monomethyl ester cyclase